MVKLIEIDGNNFPDIVRLRVQEDQARFLDSAKGILARGYAYRKTGRGWLALWRTGGLWEPRL